MFVDPTRAPFGSWQAYPLLLFGGQLKARIVGGSGGGSAEVSVGDGDWIRFRTSKVCDGQRVVPFAMGLGVCHNRMTHPAGPKVVASLIEQVRAAMEGLLAAKIADPKRVQKAFRQTSACSSALRLGGA